MHWKTYAMLLLVSGVVLYLFIRKARDQGIPLVVQNMAMFLVTCATCGILLAVSPTRSPISATQMLIIAATAVSCSWLGNLASLKALHVAPNPGYALVIQRSHVLYTTVASVWLFGSELTVITGAGCVLVVLFSAAVLIDRKAPGRGASGAWIPYSFGAFFMWGTLSLVYRYLLDQGVGPVVLMFYLTLFVSILILGQAAISASKTKWPALAGSRAATIIVIGISAAVLNLSCILGIMKAPNPGYITGMNVGSVSVIALLSALFFGDALTLRKIIGIVGVTGGLVLILL